MSPGDFRLPRLSFVSWPRGLHHRQSRWASLDCRPLLRQWVALVSRMYQALVLTCLVEWSLLVAGVLSVVVAGQQGQGQGLERDLELRVQVWG